MNKVHIYTRLTHKYRDAWRHLDSEEFLATLRMTPQRMIVAPEHHDEGGVFVQYTRAPAGADLKKLARAIVSTIGGSDCRHDFDCCGCESRRVRVQHVGNRRLKVTTSLSYNY